MQHRQLGTPSPLPATAQGGVGLGQPGARAHSEPGERVGRCLGAYWRSDVADRLRACPQWRAASCARRPSTRRLPTCPPSHPWCRWGVRRRYWPAALPGHSASPPLLRYRGAGGARGAARPAAAHDVHGVLARPPRALHRHRAVRAQRRTGLAAFAGAACAGAAHSSGGARPSPQHPAQPHAASWKPTTAAAHLGMAFTLGPHYIAEVRPPPAPPPAPPARFGAAAWAARRGPPSPRRRLAFGRQRRSAPAPRPPAWPSRLAPCCHSIPPYPSPPLPPSGGHRAAGGHAAAGGARHRCGGVRPLRRRQGGGRRELSCWLLAGCCLTAVCVCVCLCVCAGLESTEPARPDSAPPGPAAIHPTARRGAADKAGAAARGVARLRARGLGVHARARARAACVA